MALIEWIAVAAVGGLIHKGIKDSRARTAEEQRRKNTPCNFNEGITQQQFTEIAQRAGKHIKRLKKLSVNGPLVYGTVRAQSGISEWEFTIDFNDYGHITGRYWLSSENEDSSIPKHVADNISSLVHSHPEGFQEDCVSNKDKDTTNHIAYCTYCGKQIIPDGAQYCPYCGHKCSE